MMAPEKVLEVLNRYERSFAHLQAPEAAAPFDHRFTPHELANGSAHDVSLRHCRFMIGEIRKMLKEDREKAMRWLGFLQGVLWSFGEFNIDQLREHNKS